MRILLFLATNIAVLVLVSLVFNLLGLEGILAANGVDLNLGALLVMCAVFGFGGAQLIWRLDDGYCAGSDHRKDGGAVGY